MFKSHVKPVCYMCTYHVGRHSLKQMKQNIFLVQKQVLLLKICCLPGHQMISHLLRQVITLIDVKCTVQVTHWLNIIGHLHLDE